MSQLLLLLFLFPFNYRKKAKRKGKGRQNKSIINKNCVEMNVIPSYLTRDFSSNLENKFSIFSLMGLTRYKSVVIIRHKLEIKDLKVKNKAIEILFILFYFIKNPIESFVE